MRRWRYPGAAKGKCRATAYPEQGSPRQCSNRASATHNRVPVCGVHKRMLERWANQKRRLNLPGA